MPKINTIAELKAANKAAGFYWFSPDTMSFFSSAVESEVLVGNRFVTSEKTPSGRKGYTVREFDQDTARIHTVGRFMGYATKREAVRASRTL